MVLKKSKSIIIYCLILKKYPINSETATRHKVIAPLLKLFVDVDFLEEACYSYHIYVGASFKSDAATPTLFLAETFKTFDEVNTIKITFGRPLDLAIFIEDPIKTD